MISFKQARRNETLNAIDVFFATPFIVLVTQYAPVLVTRLEASSLLLGFLTSGSALVVTLGSILGPRWLLTSRNYYWAFGLPSLIWRMVTFIIPFALLQTHYQAEIIVLGTILLSSVSGFANFTLTAYFPRMTLPDRVAKLVSLRWIMLGFGMSITTPILGMVLDTYPMPVNYSIVAVIAFVTVMMSWGALMLVKPSTGIAKSTQRAHIGWSQIRNHKPAFNYLMVTLLINSAINAAGPLITLQMVRNLKASDSDFGWYLSIFWAALAVCGLFTSRIIERWGNAFTFGIAGLGLTVQLVILALAPNLVVTYVAALIAGMSSVMFQVSSYALLVDCAPKDGYEGYVSWHSTIVNISIFAAPLIMSALVDLGLSVVVGLLICASLRAVSSIVALKM
jgi:predicted MFS family arabinose efflux permease